MMRPHPCLRVFAVVATSAASAFIPSPIRRPPAVALHVRPTGNPPPWLSGKRISTMPDQASDAAKSPPGPGVPDLSEVPDVPLPAIVAAIAAVAYAIASSAHLLPSLPADFDPQRLMTDAVSYFEAAGPLGYLYFGLAYTAAEILAIPAIPLTASAGYLFGLFPGTAVVLLSASIAASVSFLTGRYLLRSVVEEMLEDNPRFAAMDRAIGREGFKLMLLLRLSPIFPFALSNYLYGVTSVGFWPYFWGTMIGFTPGTLAYVYTGEFGKTLTVDAASGSPWYVYAGGLALGAGVIKILADVSTRAIEEMEGVEEAVEKTSFNSRTKQ